MAGLVETLQDMGLSLNEAKAYQALLRYGAANGYEVSKRSGITRSVVYGVLDRLLEKGFVLQVDSDPVMYAPLPPSQLLKEYRELYDRNLDNLERSLKQMESGVSEESYILGVAGYEDTIRKARELIRGTKHEVVVSAWGSDCVPLKEELEAAEGAGRTVIIFCHTKVPFSVGTIYEYGLAEDIIKEKWPNRRIIVATDCRNVLVGDIRHDENLGIVTTNPMIVQMAVEHVILDILHLAQLKAGIGDLAEQIQSGADYLRVIEDQHAKLDLGGAVLPTPVPLPSD
ncbi:MAG: helix-turn-helix domain-containing protein [Bacillota bacterium]|nr:TrmB family transcriptional regulator [Bacillota bacterium]HOK70781.1 helix-turn-helix domain-containing protein [Bacillota bacterium]HOL50872.1 helix-turn-helix domain-containing protein [Bacillota bacterium]HPQ03631.1 helix-turn-helix domain-containing protein [Bacillota bacterium]HPZ14003.1 helix-turn-helix domain-containing protein [Bacillota bacterium]